MKAQIIANIIDEDHARIYHCQCEHGNCHHPKKDGPCVNGAFQRVHFDGAGAFDLCEGCIATYRYEGYEFETERTPTISRQCEDADHADCNARLCVCYCHSEETEAAL